MTATPPKFLSLADKVLSVFIAEQCNEMDVEAFVKKWDETHCEDMNHLLLSKLPFLNIIQRDSNDEDFDDYDNGHIFLTLEHDDCCSFCASDQCKCIHVLDSKYYCSQFEDTGKCNDLHCTLFHRANVKMIQRLMDCFKKHNARSLKFSQLKATHNELFPQFKSHCPTEHNIKLRFPHTFHFQSMEENNDPIVEWEQVYESRQLRRRWSDTHAPFSRKQAIIPEQTEMFKVFLKLRKKWIDKHLIAELLRHFKMHALGVPLQDMYIPRRNRSGFLSFKKEEDAEAFIDKTKTQELKCGGRTVRARRWKLRNNEEQRIRVQIQNLGCCVSFPQFVSWSYEHIASQQSAKIYDLQIINNTVTQGADYAILCVRNESDAKVFMKQLEGKTFRDLDLTFSAWSHPGKMKQNVNKTRAHSIPTPIGKKTDDDRDFEQRKSLSRLHRKHSLSKTASHSESAESGASALSAFSNLSFSPERNRPGFGTKYGRERKRKEMSFKDWLFDVVECGEYYEAFIKQGLDSMDVMDPQYITHEVLQDIGVQKIGHRIKILKAIRNFSESISPRFML
eukprot:742087_1